MFCGNLFFFQIKTIFFNCKLLSRWFFWMKIRMIRLRVIKICVSITKDYLKDYYTEKQTVLCWINNGFRDGIVKMVIISFIFVVISDKWL